MCVVIRKHNDLKLLQHNYAGGRISGNGFCEGLAYPFDLTQANENGQGLIKKQELYYQTNITLPVCRGY